MINKFSAVFAGLSLLATPLLAQEVNITPDMASASFTINGNDVVIARNQDADARLDSEFSKTSRACPPFCIHPMSAGEGVETVGEIEVIDFIDTYVSQGTGLLIDSRIPAWFEKGTIPGAINIPFSTLSPENQYRDEILKALGAVKTGDTWDFANAIELMMFCNGPWCDQSPQAIRDILNAGYPAEKIRYYRGGMQLWLLLGLTTVQSANG